MSDDLKPCPICGDKVKTSWQVDIRPDNGSLITKWWIIHVNKTCIDAIGWFHTREKAIEAWNHRPAPEWSTEPPTEPGWYVMLFEIGGMKLARVFSSGERVAYPHWRLRGRNDNKRLERHPVAKNRRTPATRIVDFPHEKPVPQPGCFHIPAKLKSRGRKA